MQDGGKTRNESGSEISELQQRISELEISAADREREQESLREDRERYGALFTGITDGVFVHHITDDGRPGQFIDVNDVACEMLGYTRDELLAMEIGDVDAPESAVDARHLVQELKAGRSVLFEQVHATKAGKRIPVEIHAQTFMFRGRLAILSTIRDITERKRAAEERRQLQAQIQHDQILGLFLQEVPTRPLRQDKARRIIRQREVFSAGFAGVVRMFLIHIMHPVATFIRAGFNSND